MPTGYTSKLYEDQDISFYDFVMNCARAFVRIEPMPISEFHTEGLKNATNKLIEVRNWNHEQANIAAHDNYEKYLSYYESEVKERLARRARYASMLSKINKWWAPRECQDLKEFLITQLLDSIRTDTDIDDISEPKEYSGEEYRKYLEEHCSEDISYFTLALQQEADRNAVGREFVKSLQESLRDDVD
jgi:hypothetical protein